jgi:hypothetical protein
MGGCQKQAVRRFKVTGTAGSAAAGSVILLIPTPL